MANTSRITSAYKEASRAIARWWARSTSFISETKTSVTVIGSMRTMIEEKVNRAKLSRSMSVPGAMANVMLHILL
jgi:hypothetical protein